MINDVKCLSVVDVVLSSISIHLCKTAINMCVVDLPGRQRNWFLSKSGSSDGISQSFTMPFRTLATVGRRDIGLISFWIEVGGWTFGIATTSADFQIRGKNPSLRDALTRSSAIAERPRDASCC